MSGDVRWPTEVRGGHPLVAWLNRFLAASKAAQIHEVKVVNGAGKIKNGSAIISMNPQSVDAAVFPFKIYNINNVSATGAQKALFPPAVPPAPNPFTVPTIDNLTFQIRRGIVGARSYLTLPVAGSSGNNFLDLGANGNFEQAVLCENTLDTDPANEDLFFFPEAANNGVSTVLDSTNKTLLFGIPAGSPLGTAPIVSNQIILNPNVAGTPGIASTYNWSASFWIEIVDDANNGLYANLWGRMFATQLADPTGRTTTRFPAGSNIIPIGLVQWGFIILSETFGPIITQYATANLINRFQPTLGNQRGRWNAIFSGNANLVFYPGDIVVDDSTPVAFAGTNIFRVWQMVAAAPIFPAVGATPVAPNWAIIGMTDS